uniref:Pleckstrin and Sec7 domain containing 4 n=1 Tax=Aquila chrysaetos chrysaetos TaxID=223781 RepID=A0A663ENQ6_AQUCH
MGGSVSDEHRGRVPTDGNISPRSMSVDGSISPVSMPTDETGLQEHVPIDGTNSSKSTLMDETNSTKSVRTDGSISHQRVPKDGSISPKSVPTDGSISHQRVPNDGSISPKSVPMDGIISPKSMPMDWSISPKSVPVDGSISPKSVPMDGIISPKSMPMDWSISPKSVPVDGSISPKSVPVDWSISPKSVPMDGSISPKSVPMDGSISPKSVPVDGSISQEHVPMDGSILPESVPTDGTISPEHVPMGGRISPKALTMDWTTSPKSVPTDGSISPAHVPVDGSISPEFARTGGTASPKRWNPQCSEEEEEEDDEEDDGCSSREEDAEEEEDLEEEEPHFHTNPLFQSRVPAPTGARRVPLYRPHGAALRPLLIAEGDDGTGGTGGGRGCPPPHQHPPTPWVPPGRRGRRQHHGAGCPPGGSAVTPALANGGQGRRGEAQRLAARLFHLDDFKKSQVAAFLRKNNDFSGMVAQEYLDFFQFGGQTLDQALRSFLQALVLTGETQERERILGHFSRRYHHCNPGAFPSPDAVHSLTCAIMLLNTDLHGQRLGRAMTSAEFVANLSGMMDGQDFPREQLKALYGSIRSEKLAWAEDEEEEEEEETAGGASLAPPGCKKSNPFLDLPGGTGAVTYRRGWLARKVLAEADGKKTPWGRRGWKPFQAVLKGTVLYFLKPGGRTGVPRRPPEPGPFPAPQEEEGPEAEEPLGVHHALAERASKYTKRPNVFRLQTADWRVFLFQAPTSEEMFSWISRINLVAALFSSPPFPAAVGSQRRFVRPILPAAPSRVPPVSPRCRDGVGVTHGRPPSPTPTFSPRAGGAAPLPRGVDGAGGPGALRASTQPPRKAGTSPRPGRVPPEEGVSPLRETSL